MKKIVVKLDLQDNKEKQKAMKVVSTLQGIDSIAVDMKEKKMTVVGSVDLVSLVSRLRKSWRTDIVSVGPAKEEPKKEDAKKEEGKKEEAKDEKKKEEGNKGEEKKDDGEMAERKLEPHELKIAELLNAYKYNPHLTTHYYVQSAEENPNSCTIM